LSFSKTAARGNESKEPARLLVAVQVGHEAPEHRHDEQVEHADPDEKGLRSEGRSDSELEQDVEYEQDGDEEQIDDRQEFAARITGGNPAEQRYRGKHGHECAGEQPLQIFHPALDAHFIANRAEDVIAAQQAEEIGK